MQTSKQPRMEKAGGISRTGRLSEKRLSVQTAVLLSLIVSALIVTGAVAASTSSDDFDVGSLNWNGMSRFRLSTAPTILHGLDPLLDGTTKPSSSILFLIGPAKPYAENDAATVRLFLEGGGIVTLMDDYGSGNGLLALLGVQTSFDGAVLRDPLFRGKDTGLVKVIDFKASPYTANVSSLTLNYATSLSVQTTSRTEILAHSSIFSYLDYNGNGLPDAGEPTGPLPVVAKIELGNGALILVSDSSLFINAMIDQADNLAFLRDLVAYRRAFIDASHWVPSEMTTLKTGLTGAYNVAKADEVKYTLMSLFAIAVISIRWIRNRKRDEEEGEMRKVIKEHPDWNRDLLRMLEALRRGQ